MIPTTYNGEAVWLVPHAPQWVGGVVLRAKVATHRQRGLTGRESRESLGTSLRCSLRWESVLTSPDLNLLRNALAADQDQRRVVPAWPFALPGSDWNTALVDGGLIVGWQDDWSAWDLDPVNPAQWDWVAPALVGRLDVELPSMLRPDLGRVGFSLEEDASADLALLPLGPSWRLGPALNDGTQPWIFPFLADWATPPQAGLPRIEVTRRRMGDAPRRRVAAVYPQAPGMAVSARVRLVGQAGVAQMLRWWADVQGDGRPHYVGSLMEAVRVAAPATAGSTELQLHDASLLGPYRFLSITDAAGAEHVIRCLPPVGNTVGVVGGLPVDVDPSHTWVSVASLARHADSECEIRLESPVLGEAGLAWTEVPEEYSVQDSPAESRGTTVGQIGTRAWLYEFSVDRAGVVTSYRYTNYERDLDAEGQLWAAEPIQHTEIRRTVRLDKDETAIQSRTAPWAEEFLPGRFLPRVRVRILEGMIEEGEAVEVAPRWTGEITQVSWDGPVVQATARGPYAVFDHQVPRMVLQPGCNHALFDARCGLSRGAWTIPAVAIGSGAGIEVPLSGWPVPVPSGFGTADWFALGYLVVGGDRFLILRSTSIQAEIITVTLNRRVEWSSGQQVSVVPGCDGGAATCQEKFDNFSRFGGFPFSPTKNPAFTPPKRTEASYGKK